MTEKEKKSDFVYKILNKSAKWKIYQPFVFVQKKLLNQEEIFCIQKRKMKILLRIFLGALSDCGEEFWLKLNGRKNDSRPVETKAEIWTKVRGIRIFNPRFSWLPLIPLFYESTWL